MSLSVLVFKRPEELRKFDSVLIEVSECISFW